MYNKNQPLAIEITDKIWKKFSAEALPIWDTKGRPEGGYQWGLVGFNTDTKTVEIYTPTRGWQILGDGGEF